MLKHPKWQRIRLEVMNRADFKCEKYGCDYPSDETNPLNVHHEYYDEENKWLEPWEYPITSLKCLCEKHHREIHMLEEENPSPKKSDFSRMYRSLPEEHRKYFRPKERPKKTSDFLNQFERELSLSGFQKEQFLAFSRVCGKDITRDCPNPECFSLTLLHWDKNYYCEKCHLMFMNES